MNDEPEYVGFWLRFIAFLIDSIAAAVLIGIVGTILFGASPALDPEAVLENPSAMLSNISYQAFATAILFVGFWMYFCSTPGKMIFDAYIVDAKTLKPAGNGKLIIRYIGYYVSTFLLFLGFIWIAFDKRKQGLHDKLAGTVVIKGKPIDIDDADTG
jgi:uncharacterized RDD family membrane protein YckC